MQYTQPPALCVCGCGWVCGVLVCVCTCVDTETYCTYVPLTWFVSGRNYCLWRRSVVRMYEVEIAHYP